MINIHSIRTVPPDVNAEEALKILKFVHDELMKDKTRCLTASGKTMKLMLHYEGKLQ